MSLVGLIWTLIRIYRSFDTSFPHNPSSTTTPSTISPTPSTTS